MGSAVAGTTDQIFGRKSLSSSGNYPLKLRGHVSRAVIDRMVQIQPAKNRDQTEELDRYWLDAMIRYVELVEKIWNQVRIKEINLLVRVGSGTSVLNHHSQGAERKACDNSRSDKNRIKLPAI